MYVYDIMNTYITYIIRYSIRWITKWQKGNKGFPFALLERTSVFI